jgi:hypothetical protein
MILGVMTVCFIFNNMASSVISQPFEDGPDRLRKISCVAVGPRHDPWLLFFEIYGLLPITVRFDWIRNQ